jgi:hypothetical protein
MSGPEWRNVEIAEEFAQFLKQRPAPDQADWKHGSVPPVSSVGGTLFAETSGVRNNEKATDENIRLMQSTPP